MPAPPLCSFVRRPSDDQLESMLSHPPLVDDLGSAQIIGLEEHIPACQECSSRLQQLLRSAPLSLEERHATAQLQARILSRLHS
jgi:hypothetical protein